MTDTRYRGALVYPIPTGAAPSWDNRYFIDTEFTDFQRCQLISVAVVGENGDEFYGERTDFDP